jgi:hypothetical protein
VAVRMEVLLMCKFCINVQVSFNPLTSFALLNNLVLFRYLKVIKWFPGLVKVRD